MEHAAWLAKEAELAGEEHADPAYAAGYDRKAAHDTAGELALLRELGLGEAATLVDLGAGTGALAIAAAPTCRRVVAVDISSEMLAVLRARAERLGLENVETVQSGFLTYEHSGDAADIVYSRNALHHLPDFWKALALERVASMLRPAGILRLRDLVYSFEPHEAEQVIEAWLATASESPTRG